MSEIVKYDRAKLKHLELQPLREVDGHTICVNSLGQFTAKVGEVEVQESTYGAAEEKVHRAHMALQLKRKKKALAVPAFILDRSTGGYRGIGKDRKAFCGNGFFRGIHAGNGAVQYSHLDGTKAFSDQTTVWDPSHPDVYKVAELHALLLETSRAWKIADKELSALIRHQQERMYAKSESNRGYSHQISPRIVNNAEKAAEVADQIIESALKLGSKKEGK